jgi:hypothetical protein
MDLNTYLNYLIQSAKDNEKISLDASSNPIELNWDYYNWYQWIGEERYTEAHLALCNLGYTFDNYKK